MVQKKLVRFRQYNAQALRHTPSRRQVEEHLADYQPEFIDRTSIPEQPLRNRVTMTQLSLYWQAIDAESFRKQQKISRDLVHPTLTTLVKRIGRLDELYGSKELAIVKDVSTLWGLFLPFTRSDNHANYVIGAQIYGQDRALIERTKKYVGTEDTRRLRHTISELDLVNVVSLPLQRCMDYAQHVLENQTRWIQAEGTRGRPTYQQLEAQLLGELASIAKLGRLSGRALPFIKLARENGYVSKNPQTKVFIFNTPKRKTRRKKRY
jgi:hypothetical protein